MSSPSARTPQRLWLVANHDMIEIAVLANSFIAVVCTMVQLLFIALQTWGRRSVLVSVSVVDKDFKVVNSHVQSDTKDSSRQKTERPSNFQLPASTAYVTRVSQNSTNTAVKDGGSTNTKREHFFVEFFKECII